MAAEARLSSAGLETTGIDDTICCFAEKVETWRIEPTDALGIGVDWVEAAAFAWLAHRRLENLPGNVPAVTGASRETVLGAIYPP